ncbi:MAG: hypothetical protein EKK57_00375 [Proteobacteria bacterium]|nr:MAG: hypothetical protein EKK57_00375 [Pseudomonadota bacterium]
MIEINLLPAVKQDFIRAKRLKRIITSVSILVTIVALGLLGLAATVVYAIQPVTSSFLDKAIDEDLAKLNQDKNLTRNLTIQNQLSSITQLHEQKGNVVNIFEYLKALNPAAPNNLTISKMQLDPSTTTMNIEASAADFSRLAIIKDTFNAAVFSYAKPKDDGGGFDKVKDEKVFSEVSITDPSLSNDSDGKSVVSFKMALTYNPLLFDWTLKNIIVSIPQKNTTPTANSVNLFAENPTKKEEVAQ